MLLDDIALTMHPEIGCKTAIHLLECFGSAESLFAATGDEIVQRARLKPSLARSISRREYHDRAGKEMEFIHRHRIRAVCSDSPEYPQRLKECPDYPHVLYVSGEIDLNTARWLSVVGTRKITPYGSRACDELIAGIAERYPGTVIVSGLAYGVDIAAHRAAMDAGLATVGVVAHPLTHIYPARHTESARRMVAGGGAVLSEFPSGSRPDRSGFVQRNRIIAGLSDGTLVVESAARGGSLITADMADGYHRSVMAVPGRIGDPCSEGTNGLIRMLKAQMACSAEDIGELLGWSAAVAGGGKAAEPLEPTLFAGGADDPAARKVLEALGAGLPVPADELASLCGIAPHELPPLLLELELAGEIRSLPGNLYVKNRLC